MITMLSGMLLLGGCAGSANSLEDVKVGTGSNPAVEVPDGFNVEKVQTTVVNAGGGSTIAEGETIKVNFVAINSRTGEQVDNSFSGGTPLPLTLAEGSVQPGFIEGLVGEKIGSRVLVAMSPADAFGGSQLSLDVKTSDSLVFLFDLIAKIPDTAIGKQRRLPASLPRIVLKDGKPRGFKATGETAPKPRRGTKSRSWSAIVGRGAAIESDQMISVQYVGQIYPNGEIFDESWSSGPPRSFRLAELYRCWQDQLPGKRLGSRIVVECPPGTAGASPPKGAAADDTLLFIIDLLDAS